MPIWFVPCSNFLQLCNSPLKKGKIISITPPPTPLGTTCVDVSGNIDRCPLQQKSTFSAVTWSVFILFDSFDSFSIHLWLNPASLLSISFKSKG